MFCPQCGINQSEELRFCKSCGANLHAVRQAITTRETDEKFDWNKTWVAEMLLSSDEHAKRKQERESDFTAEAKRYNEIKGGVITSCAGIGVMIFLFVFMQGIVMGGNVSREAAEILSRVWIAGVIPFIIGLGLIFNGVVVGKKLVEIKKRELQQKQKDTGRFIESAAKERGDALLSSADWNEADALRPSVTEHTTRQLKDSRQKQ